MPYIGKAHWGNCALLRLFTLYYFGFLMWLTLNNNNRLVASILLIFVFGTFLSHLFDHTHCIIHCTLMCNRNNILCVNSNRVYNGVYRNIPSNHLIRIQHNCTLQINIYGHLIQTTRTWIWDMLLIHEQFCENYFKTVIVDCSSWKLTIVKKINFVYHFNRKHAFWCQELLVV